MKKSKAFTLIELIAVLVILAILALIVSPLVLNIIKKARTAADKRSIDAYGRSIELANADYLLDKGEFPTSIDQLTIEYTGDKVECETTKLNSDSSVYLAECTVGGRNVSGYTYGKEQTVTYKAYSVGDEVTYNNVDYRVIKDSSTSESSVTLLKAEPLTTEEVQTYSAGTGARTDGYGGMAYYSSETCGYVNGSYVDTGCTTDYAQSEIKYVVDAWKTAQAPRASEARLITFEELVDSFGYEYDDSNPTSKRYNKTANTPNWVYSNNNSNYYYYTMSPYQDSDSRVWYVDIDGNVSANRLHLDSGMVRPVIVLSKSEL